eukprot:scaffold64297_cov39-Prasinocladus_malaysianus.AAC.1
MYGTRSATLWDARQQTMIPRKISGIELESHTFLILASRCSHLYEYEYWYSSGCDGTRRTPDDRPVLVRLPVLVPVITTVPVSAFGSGHDLVPLLKLAVAVLARRRRCSPLQLQKCEKFYLVANTCSTFFYD